MPENILEKIIKNKEKKIDLLKKSIKIETLKNKIDENKSFVNFKDAYDNAREHILSGKTHKHLKKIQSAWKYIRKNN